jgi:hypothetical protein
VAGGTREVSGLWAMVAAVGGMRAQGGIDPLGCGGSVAPRLVTPPVPPADLLQVRAAGAAGRG